MSAPSYQCPKCGAISFNENDIEHKYCGRCHEFESSQPIIVRTRLPGETEESDWHYVGRLTSDKPLPASFASDNPDGREIYYFGWHSGLPGVWKTPSGTDYVVGDLSIFEDYSQVADLREKPFQFTVYRSKQPFCEIEFSLQRK